jgi:type I restriction enzyme S subunit
MKMVPLGEIADVKSGYAFKSLDYQPNGVKLVRIGNLSDGKLDFGTDTACIPEEYLKDYNEFALDEGDVLIAMSGATTGKLALVSRGDLPCLLNQRVGRFKVVEKEKLHPQFLFYFLSKLSIKNKILELAGGSAQPNVSPTSLKELLIPLLPLISQQQIAAILEKADAAREKRRQANQLAEQFLQSAFLEMFGDPATNPKGWEFKQLGELLDLKNGKAKPTKYLNTEYPYPVYGGNGITGFADEYFLEEPTLVIGRVGVYCGIIHKTQPKSWATDNSMYAIFKHKEINIDFLKELLTNLHLNRFAHQFGQPYISQEKILEKFVPFPPLPEQQEFAALVEKVESLRARQRQSEQELEQLFHSLMQRAFRGELVG